EILPRETFRPTSPHAPAGIRIDPPPSDPCAIGTIPAATAAPAPPEEPPGDRVGSHGFTGGGAISVSVYGGRPSSGVAVLPTRLAPASANRVPTPSSTPGTKPSRAAEPACIGTPATIVRSLIGTGTPSSAPACATSPAATCSSTARARASAVSSATCT